jgi:alkylation response protein AidB-like acyl-CoA dehydrogenase
MDFTITDESKALAEAVRAVAGRHGDPAAEAGRAAAPPALDSDLWQALVEVGLPGLPWAEEDGGLGATWADLSAAATELGRARLQTPLAEVSVAAAVVARLGSGTQRQEIIGGLTEGTVVPVPAIAEPLRAWGEPAETTATETDGTWTLTGTKAPVRYASGATHLVVTASVEGQTGLFLVAAPQTEQDVVVLDGTEAAALGTGEEADVALREALALGGVVLAAEALGAMEQALRLTTEYLGTREQFGRKLAAFQTLTHRAADMYAQLELARSSALYSALLADDRESGLDLDGLLRARVAVNKAGRVVSQEAIQMHGGIGVTAEHPVGHLAGRLTEISRTFGSTQDHLASLATRVGDHGSVDLLA